MEIQAHSVLQIRDQAGHPSHLRQTNPVRIHVKIHGITRNNRSVFATNTFPLSWIECVLRGYAKIKPKCETLLFNLFTISDSMRLDVYSHLLWLGKEKFLREMNLCTWKRIGAQKKMWSWFFINCHFHLCTAHRNTILTSKIKLFWEMNRCTSKCLGAQKKCVYQVTFWCFHARRTDIRKNDITPIFILGLFTSIEILLMLQKLYIYIHIYNSSKSNTLRSVKQKLV